MFRWGTKCKLKQPSNVVTLQLNHALSTSPDNFCQRPKKMYYPLHIKATLFISFCVTVIVDMWIVLIKGYNRGLNSTCLKSFSRDIFLRTEAHWSALASQSEALKLKLPFSATRQHLLQNPTCASEYNDNKFSILARNRTSFHLSTLESTYIKTSKPNLCKQREFVYGLKIAN